MNYSIFIFTETKWLVGCLKFWSPLNYKTYHYHVVPKLKIGGRIQIGVMYTLINGHVHKLGVYGWWNLGKKMIDWLEDWFNIIRKREKGLSAVDENAIFAELS